MNFIRFTDVKKSDLALFVYKVKNSDATIYIVFEAKLLIQMISNVIDIIKYIETVLYTTNVVRGVPTISLFILHASVASFSSVTISY